MATSNKEQDVSVQVAALGAVYQAERSENVTLLNINIALIGAELAYAAATVAFLDKIAVLPRVAAVAIPIPLWLGMLYNVLLVALAGRRGASALIVENELLAHTGIRQDKRRRVGSLAGEYIVNPIAAPWPYKILLAVVYLTPWLLAGAYTWYILDTFVVAGAMFYAGLTGYVVVLAVAVSASVRAALDTPKVPDDTAQPPTRTRARRRTKGQRRTR